MVDLLYEGTFVTDSSLPSASIFIIKKLHFPYRHLDAIAGRSMGVQWFLLPKVESTEGLLYDKPLLPP